MDEIYASPSDLRDGSEQMRSRVATSLAALPEYSLAVARFNQSPMSPEVAYEIEDLSGGVRDVLEQLGVDDELLATFAAALEDADATVGGLDALPDSVRMEIAEELARLAVDGGDLAADGQTVVAEVLGRHAADRLETLRGEGSMEQWEQWAEMVEPFVDDEAFAVAFMRAVGPEHLVEMPNELSAAFQEAGGDVRDEAPMARPWDVLQVVSATLATATRTVGEPDGMTTSELDALFAAGSGRDGHPGWHPEELSQFGLLFVSGDFGHETLLRVAEIAEQELPDYRNPPAFHTPWQPFDHPASTLLPAIGQDPIAAASQPRVLTHLVGLGELDGQALDLAYAEAALHADADADYGQIMAEEHAEVGLIELEDVGAWATHLAFVGHSLDLASAGADTVGALQGRASQAGRDLPNINLTPEQRSQASHTLRDTPRHLRTITSSQFYQVTGRALPVVGFGVDVLHMGQEGVGAVEATTRAGFSAAAGVRGGGAVGSRTFPLLKYGPPGWIAYGGTVLVGGGSSAFLGDRTTAAMFDVFTPPPEDNLWAVRGLDGEGMPRPGPVP